MAKQHTYCTNTDCLKQVDFKLGYCPHCFEVFGGSNGMSGLARAAYVHLLSKIDHGCANFSCNLCDEEFEKQIKFYVEPAQKHLKKTLKKAKTK